MEPIDTHRTARPVGTRGALQRLMSLCSDARHHCALVLVANLGLVGCGLAGPFQPALALHLLLVPVNAWRLVRAWRVGPPAAVHASAAERDEVTVLQRRAAALRCQFMTASAAMQTVRLPPRVPG